MEKILYRSTDLDLREMLHLHDVLDIFNGGDYDGSVPAGEELDLRLHAKRKPEDQALIPFKETSH